MASFNSATPKTFKNTKFGLWTFAFLDFGRYSISTIFSDTFCEHPPFHSISHYTVKHAFIVTTLSMIVRSHCGALEVTRLDTERYWTITLTINLIPIVGAEKIGFKVWRSILTFPTSHIVVQRLGSYPLEPTSYLSQKKRKSTSKFQGQPVTLTLPT